MLDILKVQITKLDAQLVSQPEPIYHWLLFFFGLCWRRKLEFDTTKYMISTLLEFLVHCLVDFHVVGEAYNNAPMFMLLLCIAETGDDDLWKKFTSNFGINILRLDKQPPL